MPIRIMGLDISTTTIGICVLEKDKNIKLIHVGAFLPWGKNKKLKDEIDDIDMIKRSKDYIISVAEKYKVDEFAIEDYVRFMKGKSSAATVIPLAILNRTICLGIFEKFNKKPHIYNVLKIRHAIKLSKELPKKEEIPELVAKILDIQFPYVYKDIRRKKGVSKDSPKEVKIDDTSYDMADSIAVALCYCKL